jgi:O-antigen/teichoic acid export membrane protein
MEAHRRTGVSAPQSPPDGDLPAILSLAVETPLAGRVRRGVAWTAGSRVVLQVLQVAATAVLARLLNPADYGLSALVAIVAGFAAIFVDLGIPSAVIQRPRLDSRYLSTAFWMNFGFGVLMAALVCAAAVPTARFFDEPQLVGLMLLSSLTFVLSLNAVHLAVLQRTMAFARISRMTVVSTTVGLVVSVCAAAAGLGAVSLVIGPIAQRATSVLQVWLTVRWLPRYRPSRNAAREIWSFGRGLAGTNILNYWVGSADRLLIGRLVTIADLGFYNRSTNLMMLPIQQTTRALSGVFYPALASMSGEPDRLSSAWLRLLRAAWIMGIPMSVVLVFTAPTLVETLYGPGWGPVVPILVVLSAGVPFLLLGATSGPVYQALGRTGLQFKIGLINAVVALTALGIGIQWGVIGVAVAVVVRNAANVVLSLPVLLRLLRVPFRRVVDCLWRSLIAGAAMAAAVWGADLLTVGVPKPLALASQVIAGLAVYGPLVWYLERETIRQLIGRKRRRTRADGRVGTKA